MENAMENGMETGTEQETVQTSSPSPAAPFQLSAVEKELRSLWKEASSSSETAGAVLRACVLNLIVWDEAGGMDPGVLISEVSREAPGRIFLLVLDPGIEIGTILSEVNSVCHLRKGGGHICGEQIRLSCNPASAKLLPSVVQSLLLGELPVVLWCADGMPLSFEPFERLVRMADQVIFDSSSLDSSDRFRTFSAMVVRRLKHGKVTMDLVWGRLTAWRDQVAAFFEPVEHRMLIPRLRRIEIEQAGGMLPSPEALLLAGWVTARLGWAWSEATPDEDAPAWNFAQPGSPGELCIRPGGSSDAPGAVVSLRMATGSGHEAESVLLHIDQGRLVLSMTPPSSTPLPAALPVQPGATSRLLIRSLEARGVDSHYSQAVDAAVSLLDTMGAAHE